MATTTIPWGDGSGDNIYLTYSSASGDQTVEVSSDANSGYTDRVQTVSFTASANGASVVKVLTVTQEGVPEPYIVFADSTVEQICATNWGDGVGLKASQAKNVTNTQIQTVFRGNTSITSFDEFIYFTGVTTVYGSSSSPYGSFGGCTALASITIPPNVTAVNTCAFRGDSSLTTVTFTRDGATTVATNTFYGANISRINFPTLTAFLNTTWSGSEPFFNTNNNTGRRNHDIYIGDEKLTEVTIPSNLTSIKAGAFAGATSITGTLIIPSTVTSIGANAFINCWNLSNLYIKRALNLNASVVWNSATEMIYLSGNLTQDGSGYYCMAKHIVILGNFSSANRISYFLRERTISCRILGNLSRVTDYMSDAGNNSSKLEFFELGGTYTGSTRLFFSNAARGLTNGCIVHLAYNGIAATVDQICASYSRLAKIYVGPGESQAGDQAILDQYLANSSWAAYSSKLDLWWNYSGSYKE